MIDSTPVDKSFEDHVTVQTHNLIEAASHLSVKTYLFVASNIPIVKSFVKKQDYEAARELLDVIELQISKEISEKQDHVKKE